MPVLDPPVSSLPVSSLPVSRPPVLDPPAITLTEPLRLVVSDMDGSLLDPEHRLPPELGAVLDALDARGIAFCPASGRQYENLRRLFGERGRDLVYVAENGALVVHRGTVLRSTPLPAGTVAPVVEGVRALGRDRAVGLVVCGARSAYVESTDEEFLADVRRHYALVEAVPDVLAVDDEVLKLAVHDALDVEEVVAPALARWRGTLHVLVSGRHWLDLMHPAADKGHALEAVQEALGVTAAQTIAFGDYLNDRGLLAAAGHGVAMDNAHPEVRAAARWVAPGNDRNGVLRTLAAVLELDVPGLRG